MTHFDYYVEYRVGGVLECKGFDALCYAETFVAHLRSAGIAAEMYSL